MVGTPMGYSGTVEVCLHIRDGSPMEGSPCSSGREGKNISNFNGARGPGTQSYRRHLLRPSYIKEGDEYRSGGPCNGGCMRGRREGV